MGVYFSPKPWHYLKLWCWISIFIILKGGNFSLLAFRSLWASGFPHNLPLQTLFALYYPIYEVSLGWHTLKFRCWMIKIDIQRLNVCMFLLRTFFLLLWIFPLKLLVCTVYCRNKRLFTLSKPTWKKSARKCSFNKSLCWREVLPAFQSIKNKDLPSEATNGRTMLEGGKEGI